VDDLCWGPRMLIQARRNGTTRQTRVCCTCRTVVKSESTCSATSRAEQRAFVRTPNNAQELLVAARKTRGDC
jgi:hypothetical protein